MPQYVAKGPPQVSGRTRLLIEVDAVDTGNPPMEEIFLRRGPEDESRTGQENPSGNAAHVLLSVAAYDQARSEIKENWNITYNLNTEKISNFQWSPP